MVKVIKPGFYTTLQDSGRFGLRNKGVPVSGAMDQIAYAHCNTLLENEPDSAVLEVTMTGPSLQFYAPTYMAITGADISPHLNNAPIANYRLIKVTEGDVLSFGKLEKGFRAYIGVKGGVQAQRILNSVSQYTPLTKKAKILMNEELQFDPVTDFEPKIAEMKPERYVDQEVLQVYKGPEFDVLGDQQQEMLFGSSFTIAKENNRMAYQIEELVHIDSHTMLTSATLPGTVQLTPAGKLIVLMRDGQTTGGYPRVLQLSQQAISLLAQKKTRDKVRFAKVFR